MTAGFAVQAREVPHDHLEEPLVYEVDDQLGRHCRG